MIAVALVASPGESAAALPRIDLRTMAPLPFCSDGLETLVSASLGKHPANQCSKTEPASSMNCSQACFIVLLCNAERPSDRYSHIVGWRL